MWKGVQGEMRRRRLALMLAVTMAVMLAVSACGKKEPLNEAMRNALAASMEMKSYTFDGSFVIDRLELPPGAMNEAELPYLNMVRNLTVSIRGAYVQDPLQMEMILKLTLPGDLALSFEMPVVLTADKMYIRVPNIPMFPLGEAAGKFIEFDMNELAKGQPGMPTFDVETQRKLSVELLDIVVRHLEEEAFFRELKKDEVPVKADRYVKFAVTQDNFESFMVAVVERILPECADLLLNNAEYRAALGITEEEAREFKEGLPDDPDAFRNELEERMESLRIREFSLTGAIQGDYMVYQVLKADLEFMEQGETTGFAATFSIRYDDINGNVTFEHGIPSDAIPFEEFEQSFLAGAGL